MTRINTNIPSMIAQRNLTQATDDLTTSLERLSTGLRINRGADDPAGLIVSERLRSELQGLDQAITNSERASSVVATTEGYLAEVADLLNSIKSLIIGAANTGGVSDEEIAANQLQIDSAIQSITRIANTATFAGLPLLNGSMAYLTSGVPASAIVGSDIHGAQFGVNATIPVDVEVIASAQVAVLFISGNTTGTFTSSITLEIAGNLGVQTLSFVSGTTLSSVVRAVNTVRESTGVSAALADAGGDQSSGLTLSSLAYGSEQFLAVERLGASGVFFETFEQQGGTITSRDEGRDVAAIINGALSTGDGLDVSLNTPGLALKLTLTTAYAQTTSVSKQFEITGGGANFQLGPQVAATQQVGIGIRSIAASRLGGTTLNNVRYFLDAIRSGGTFSIESGEAQNASDILDSSINEISVLRGRLGAFERNTIQTNIRALQIGFENISASESKIRDTDFASETARLTRAQILTQAGTSVLATANLMSQNVLALLG